MSFIFYCLENNNTNKNLFLSIIIPCYNESGRLPALFKALEELNEQSNLLFEIILVDDGSSDNTVNIINSNKLIAELKAQHKCIVHAKESNAGKGEALKTGVGLASGKFILTMDADVATHPLEILKWKKRETEFKDTTIYIGSREHAESEIQSGFVRKFAGRVFNLIVRIITSLNIKDTQCGFKLYPTIIGKKIFNELVNTGWAHDIELICRAKQYGYAIKEMPLKWNSVEGSKISVMRDSIKMLIETIKIKKLLKHEYGLKRS